MGRTGGLDYFHSWLRSHDFRSYCLAAVELPKSKVPTPPLAMQQTKGKLARCQNRQTTSKKMRKSWQLGQKANSFRPGVPNRWSEIRGTLSTGRVDTARSTSEPGYGCNAPGMFTHSIGRSSLPTNTCVSSSHLPAGIGLS